MICLANEFMEVKVDGGISTLFPLSLSSTFAAADVFMIFGSGGEFSSFWTTSSLLALDSSDAFEEALRLLGFLPLDMLPAMVIEYYVDY